MYRQFFGLKHAPLGKECNELWINNQIINFEKQFRWLLQSPGIGLLTSEPGLGKTAILRHITSSLNPHQYAMYYISETDFGRLDFYRQLAVQFNLKLSSRRSQLWRDLKEHFIYLVTQKCILPILIVDEAQNLSEDFFRDFPSFVNFAFDSKDYITVWFVGHQLLARKIDRHIAFSTRIQVRYELQPIMDKEQFKELILHGFTQAGSKHTILSDSAINILYMSSQGNQRIAHRIIITALRIATDRNINYLSDEIVNEAIIVLKQG
jgi:type II secretory pathway predicted ATPase ExeA